MTAISDDIRDLVRRSMAEMHDSHNQPFEAKRWRAGLYDGTPTFEGAALALIFERQMRVQAEKTIWRCFHCDETFTCEETARQHFGPTEMADPICAVTAERYRDVERQLAEFRSETDAASMTFYALGAEHSRKQRQAEEKGYERGLADGRALGPMPENADEWWQSRLPRDGETESEAAERLHQSPGYGGSLEDARLAVCDAMSFARSHASTTSEATLHG